MKTLEENVDLYQDCITISSEEGFSKRSKKKRNDIPIVMQNEKRRM